MNYPKRIQGGKYLDISRLHVYTPMAFARCRHSKDTSEVAGVWNPTTALSTQNSDGCAGSAVPGDAPTVVNLSALREATRKGPCSSLILIR